MRGKTPNMVRQSILSAICCLLAWSAASSGIAQADPGAGWIPPTSPPAPVAPHVQGTPSNQPAPAYQPVPTPTYQGAAPRHPAQQHAGAILPDGGAAAPPGFRKATGRQPSWAILARAKPLLVNGNAAQAIELIQQFVASQPLEPEGYFWLGLAYDELDQPDQAVESYRKAVAQALIVGMDCAESHTNLGNALLKGGRLDEAVVEFQRAIELDPKSSAARLNLARTFIAKQQGQEAIDALNKCNPKITAQAQLHYYRAKALLLLGKTQEAQAAGSQSMRFVQDANAREAIAKEFNCF